MDSVDCAVIGAGVIGLAAGRALAESGLEVIVLEAASAVGTGTSSRSSEVIHAGLYYPTGSLKARLCVQGRERLYPYCASKGIRHRRLGKLIVATADCELETLAGYLQQGLANGVNDLRYATAAELAREPALRCRAALLSPSTGIVDSHELMQALQADLEAAGGIVALRSPVTAVRRARERFELIAGGLERPSLSCRWLVNAAGLHASNVAAQIPGVPPASIPTPYYARGRYYTLTGRSPFNQLVYPVASAGGLGVHLTLDLAGAARFGPDVEWIDAIDYSFDPGARDAFVAAIRRYYPDLDESRLTPGYTGIRPKIAARDAPAADFQIHGTAVHGIGGLVNLYGIESPGLTAALAIADEVIQRLEIEPSLTARRSR